MKFYHSSLYPKLTLGDLKGLALFSMFAVGGLLLFGVGLEPFLSGQIGQVTGNHIFWLVMGVAVLMLCSMLSPFGWTSVYLDRSMIQVVPFRRLLRLVLPLKKTYHLNRPAHVYFGLPGGDLTIRQDGDYAEVFIDNFPEHVKHELARVLMKLARGNKNLELDIDKKLVEGRRLRFAPGENAAYSFFFRKGDRVEVTLESENEFVLELLDMTGKDGEAVKLFPVKRGSARMDEVIRLWRITNSGLHHLVLRNPFKGVEGRLEFSLTRKQRFNPVRKDRMASGAKKDGLAAAPAQINK